MSGRASWDDAQLRINGPAPLSTGFGACQLGKLRIGEHGAKNTTGNLVTGDGSKRASEETRRGLVTKEGTKASRK